MKPLTEGSEVTVTVGNEFAWNDSGISCQQHCELSIMMILVKCALLLQMLFDFLTRQRFEFDPLPDASGCHCMIISESLSCCSDAVSTVPTHCVAL